MRPAGLFENPARQGGRRGADVSSIRTALVSGAALPASLRAALEGKGVKTRQVYATADVGVIAWETDDANGALMPGMQVSGDLIVEIVTPGTDDPAQAGKVGEVVVTKLSSDYPLLRFGTGDLSAWDGPDRIKGWMGRADQSTKVKGLFVHPSQIVEIGRRHRELRALRLVVRREGEQDIMTLFAETAAPGDALASDRRRHPAGADQAAGRGQAGRSGLAAERRQDHHDERV